jgi:hypothetical protein
MNAKRRVRQDGVRLAVVFALAHAALATVAAGAQTTFEVRPLLSVTEVHDSNLFSTPSNRQADFIARLSPGVESDYRSGLQTLTSRYTFDIERFAHHDELSTMSARQQATIGWGYRPTPRLALAAGGEFLTTRTPGELTATSGLSFARARAQRAAVQSSLTRQLNPVTSGSVEYTFTEDRFARAYEARTHTATANAVRRLSSRGAVNASVGFRAFRFDSAGAGESAVTSQSLNIGWTHAITRRVRLAIAAGPRLTGGTFRPELSASVDTRFKSIDLSLAYAGTQTTVIGVAGATDIQHVRATAAWTPGRSLRMQMTPGYFRNAADGRRADVYSLAIGVTRPISKQLSFDLSYDGSLQQGHLVAGLASETITRQSVLIRLVALNGIARN